MKNEFVASAIVLNQAKSKVLMVFHKKMNKWLFPGGHLENNELPHEAVVREVQEETGVQAYVVNSGNELEIRNGIETQLPAPYCILHEVIPATSKEPEHKHVDFIYVMKCLSDDAPLQKAEEEVSEVKWFSKNEVMISDTFDGVKRICRKVL